MKLNREIKLNTKYSPLPAYEGDEIYPNGVFHFNISRIYEHINDGSLIVEKELIDVVDGSVIIIEVL